MRQFKNAGISLTGLIVLCRQEGADVNTVVNAFLVRVIDERPRTDEDLNDVFNVIMKEYMDFNATSVRQMEGERRKS